MRRFWNSMSRSFGTKPRSRRPTDTLPSPSPTGGHRREGAAGPEEQEDRRLRNRISPADDLPAVRQRGQEGYLAGVVQALSKEEERSNARAEQRVTGFYHLVAYRIRTAEDAAVFVIQRGQEGDCTGIIDGRPAETEATEEASRVGDSGERPAVSRDDARLSSWFDQEEGRRSRIIEGQPKEESTETGGRENGGHRSTTTHEDTFARRRRGKRGVGGDRSCVVDVLLVDREAVERATVRVGDDSERPTISRKHAGIGREAGEESHRPHGVDRGGEEQFGEGGIGVQRGKRPAAASEDGRCAVVQVRHESDRPGDIDVGAAQEERQWPGGSGNGGGWPAGAGEDTGASGTQVGQEGD